MPNIKIFISYHKPSVLLKSEILVPLHVGRTIAQKISKDGNISNEDLNWLYENMQGDNIGDNISNLNRRFSEVTGHYFVWKHQEEFNNPDYIGFMHYRRHLNFNSDKLSSKKQNKEYLSNFLDKKYIEYTGLNDKQIEKIVTKNDIVCVKPWNVHEGNFKNIYEQYKYHPDLNIADYDIALKILKEKYPHFAKAAKLYNASSKGWFTNVFIMKRKIFNEYSEWLFSILLECEKQIPQYDNVIKNRVIGHIAERLFGIYITYLKINNSKIKIKELQRCMVHNTEPPLQLKPIYKNEIPIVLSCDNNYLPYLSVTLQSIIDNASQDKKYSIYVLHSNTSKHYQKLINTMLPDNFNLKFLNIKFYLQDFDTSIFHINAHFSIATYFRFFIPQIFKNFTKIIYCDCDAVFLDDIANLYNINIEDYWLAATKDLGIELQLKTNTKKALRYYKDFLNLKNPYNYFQAGLLILNIDKLSQNNFTDKCIKTLIKIKSPKYVDQCILNIVCEDKVKFLNEKWNVQIYIPLAFGSYENLLDNISREKYIEAYKEPKFIHYSGCQKPWEIPSTIFAEYFWHYARKSLFYEMILYKNAEKYEQKNNLYNSTKHPRLNFLQTIFSIKNFNQNDKKYKMCTILGLSIKKKVKNV